MRKIIFALCIAILACVSTSCDSPLFSSLSASMEKSQLTGIVCDEDGKPLEEVTITTGRESATTNARGVYMLNRVRVEGDRCVVSFKKDGYFDVTRSCTMSDLLKMDIVMLKKGDKKNVSTIKKFDNRKGADIQVGKMEVSVPANSVVTGRGDSYFGEVLANVYYLDPNSPSFQSAMPGGDLEAVRSDNSSTFLKSYGMVEVSLTDPDGNALNLAQDAEAQLSFPVPAGMEKDKPAEIPLWAFDEQKGVWVEEGMATYNAERDLYIGKVQHFSWHNLDVPSERVTVFGAVRDCQERPIAGVRVTVGQTSAYTNQNGEYSVFIPKNTEVEIYVRSSDYYNYSEGKPLILEATEADKAGAPVLSLPCMSTISGRVKNTCSGRPLALVYIDYTIGKKQYTSAPVWSHPETGAFSLRFPSNAKTIMLHVESEEGSTFPRPYFNLMGDIDAGEIEICLDNQNTESLSVTCGDEKFDFAVNEQTLDVASDIGGLFGALSELFNLFSKDEKFEISPRFITITTPDEQSVLSITVKEFREGKSTYDAEICFTSGETQSSGTGFFTVIEHKNKATLLSLSCALTSANKKKATSTPITVSGIFSIPDMANGSKMIGSIPHMPEKCPALPKPILSTFQYQIDGHWITGAMYHSMDYDGYKEKLLKAGAVCLQEEKTEKDGSTVGVFYHPDYMVSIDQMRILVMDKPTPISDVKNAKIDYSISYRRGSQRETEDGSGFEINVLESKAMYQTICDYPVKVAYK